jgi:geranylgeranyl diphosphate synthase, type I
VFEGDARRQPDGLFVHRPAPMLLDQVRDLTLRGGKRIRAALVYAGARLFGSFEGAPAVCDAAAAVELLHTYFLIHDDIMDEDAVRRGGPSVHAALAAATGSEKLGRDLAILAGDLAIALHEKLVAQLDAAEDRRRRVAALFAGMHADVIHGQTLDIVGGAAEEDVADHKTASYTTVGPIAIGAALAGAQGESTARLAAISRPIGIAFQLRDDLIGMFGDPAATGKPRGSDLKSGKRTLLVREAIGRAGDDDRRAIEAALGHPGANENEIAAASAAIERTGAKRLCEERATSLVSCALDELDAGGFSPEGRALITHIARIAVSRER